MTEKEDHVAPNKNSQAAQHSAFQTARLYHFREIIGEQIQRLQGSEAADGTGITATVNMPWGNSQQFMQPGHDTPEQQTKQSAHETQKQSKQSKEQFKQLDYQTQQQAKQQSRRPDHETQQQAKQQFRQPDHETPQQSKQRLATRIVKFGEMELQVEVGPNGNELFVVDESKCYSMTVYMDFTYTFFSPRRQDLLIPV